MKHKLHSTKEFRTMMPQVGLGFSLQPFYTDFHPAISTVICIDKMAESRLGKICVERALGLRTYYLNLTAGFIRWGAEWGCMYVVNRSCRIASPLQERFNRSKCIKHM